MTTTTNNSEQFIEGEWRSGAAGASIDVINPATEESIGSVPQADVKDAHAAIEAARRAFDDGPWPWMTPRERADVMKRFATILDSRREQLQNLVVAEAGLTPMPHGFLHVARSI